MASVQFQIMSDLHLETPTTRPTYGEFKIEPKCQYLALLGDIGNVSDLQLLTFLEEQLLHFKIVFYLFGNHEPYGMDLSTAGANMRAFANRMERQHAARSSVVGKFIFLDRKRYDLTDDLTVLGCTLYSRISNSQRHPVSLFVSDFSNVHDWTIDNHCAAHKVDLDWLNSRVAQIQQDEPHRSIVIFTHHSPTLLVAANDPRHVGDPAQVGSAFVTDLSREVCWTSVQVRLWAFGHTHFNCDFEEPHTRKRIVANQKGYQRRELLTFSDTKVVSVDGEARAGNGSLEGDET